MNLSIRQRLWAPAFLIALAIIAMAASMTLRTQHLVAEGNAQQALRQAQLESAYQVQVALQMLTAAPAGTDAAQAQAQVQRALARLAEGAQALAETADLQPLQQAAAASLQAGQAPAALEAASAYARLQGERASADRVAAGQARIRTIQITVGVMAAMVLMVVVSTALLVRAICPPLDEVRRVAHRIGQGDLSGSIPAGRHDEIGSVMRSLQAMQDALRNIVREVRGVAESIQVASREVASGNQDLSQRTELAAANLQRTASSMQQLSGVVQHGADAAREAQGLAEDASQVAGRGGEVVAQVVSTMQDIDSSSRRIAAIVGTIDGIAFQTNILALNAAVEAARAGEQGRGFAVVASEVRQLAGRSAAAAREVRGLIGASVERVASGTALVGDAGSTMTELVGSVERVSGVIGQITRAASEQSSGIHQVANAVTQLDEMTQRNAALVEQSAAAAASLKDQSVRLVRAVEVFQLAPAGQDR